jgi:hypothetical protein
MFLVVKCQHASGACQSHSCPVLSLHEASWKYTELSHSTPPFLTLHFHEKDLSPTLRLGRYSLRLGIFFHFALWPYALRNTALLHNNLSVLKDGTSWLKLFSSIRVGANMKHMHTIACPVFALQNALASGNQLPQWSPRAHLGLNLGPSPIHARNVYLVLNLTTGCVSPQYHCRFDNFFEMTRHGRPEISCTICWQQLAGLMRAGQCLSDLIAPMQPKTVSHENSLVSVPNTLDKFLISQVDFGSMEDDGCVTSEASYINISSVNHQSGSRMPRNLRPLQVPEGDTTINPKVSASTSQHGRARTMSQKMAESTAQWNFYGNQGMHHMANTSKLSIWETAEDVFRDKHLEIQECMRNPLRSMPR